MKGEKILGLTLFITLLSGGVWYYQTYMKNPTVIDWQVPHEVLVLWEKPYIETLDPFEMEAISTKSIDITNLTRRPEGVLFEPDINLPISAQVGAAAIVGNQQEQFIIQASEGVILYRDAKLNEISYIKARKFIHFASENKAPLYLEAQSVVIKKQPIKPLYIRAKKVISCLSAREYKGSNLRLAPGTEFEINERDAECRKR